MCPEAGLLFTRRRSRGHVYLGTGLDLLLLSSLELSHRHGPLLLGRGFSRAGAR
jgi:hypothetical protein